MTSCNQVPSCGTGGNGGAGTSTGTGGASTSTGTGGTSSSTGTGCTPASCAAQGKNCGAIDDGCGDLLDCGSCSGSDTCGGSGVPNVCGCAPKSCAAQGKSCGTIDDGCGVAIDCGTCSGNDTCGGSGVPNVCGCAPKSCEAQGKNCGTVDDGCGAAIDCGTCSGNDTCEGSGIPNVCGCTPVSDAQLCADLGKVCGPVSGTDNCGLPRSVQCGGCAQGTCQNGQCLSECGVACQPSEVCGNGCDDDCNDQTEEGCAPPTNTSCATAQTITVQNGHAKVFGYIPPDTWQTLYYRVKIQASTVNYVHALAQKLPPGGTIYMEVGDDQTCFGAGYENVPCTTPGFAGRYWTTAASGWQTITVHLSGPGGFTLDIDQMPKGLSVRTLKSGSGAQTVWTVGGKGQFLGVGGTCGGGGIMSPEAFAWVQCPESPGGLFTADTCAHAPPLAFMDPILYLRSGVTRMEMACSDDNPQCAAGPNRSRVTATIPPGTGLYALYYDFHDDPALSTPDTWQAVVDVTVP
ncbi:Tryptophan synthase alpha chain [Minicystis rosea]|nr:Tryptophan synthase alpha chain [Minicystis rosea]